MDFNNTVLDAIEFLIQDYLSKAGFNRTIDATVLECTDIEKGTYRCQYQGTIISAQSIAPEIIYDKDTTVMILVPNNDMSSEDKLILKVR